MAYPNWLTLFNFIDFLYLEKQIELDTHERLMYCISTVKPIQAMEIEHLCSLCDKEING